MIKNYDLTNSHIAICGMGRIKRIDVHNSIKGDDGLKHIPVNISFTAAGIVNIPTEQEILETIQEMRENPLKTA